MCNKIKFPAQVSFPVPFSPCRLPVTVINWFPLQCQRFLSTCLLRADGSHPGHVPGASSLTEIAPSVFCPPPRPPQAPLHPNLRADVLQAEAWLGSRRGLWERNTCPDCVTQWALLPNNNGKGRYSLTRSSPRVRFRFLCLSQLFRQRYGRNQVPTPGLFHATRCWVI